jgi:hypothetical protein
MGAPYESPDSPPRLLLWADRTPPPCLYPAPVPPAYVWQLRATAQLAAKIGTNSIDPTRSRVTQPPPRCSGQLIRNFVS